MQLKRLLTWAWVTVVVALPATALAQSTNFGLNEFSENTNLGTNIALIQTVARVINILLGFLGVLAVLIVLWAGFRWMTAAGDEEQISKAKKLMGAGVVGLVIIMAAYALAAFVIDQLATATDAIR